MKCLDLIEDTKNKEDIEAHKLFSLIDSHSYLPKGWKLETKVVGIDFHLRNLAQDRYTASGSA